jgi:hypothetical protein
MTRVCEILGGPRDGDLVADVGNVFTMVELTDTRFWSYGKARSPPQHRSATKKSRTAK